MALTVAKHLQKNHPSLVSQDQMAVFNMTVEKALIAQPRGPQYLRASFMFNLQENLGDCTFTSVNVRVLRNGKLFHVLSNLQSDGQVMMVHAHCSVHPSRQPAPGYLKDLAESTQLRIDKLREAAATEKAYRFSNSMIYRMVGSLAEFHTDFRGLKEVVLDSKAMAAASKIDLSTVKCSESKDFCMHPAYIDAFCQSAGFIMNANEDSNLESEVFVNHGWDALRLYEAIQPHRSYYSWVQMTRTEGAIWHGSLTILRNSEVVGEIENIAVSQQPRNRLENVGMNRNIANRTLSASVHSQETLKSCSLGSQSRTM